MLKFQIYKSIQRSSETATLQVSHDVLENPAASLKKHLAGISIPCVNNYEMIIYLVPLLNSS